MDECKDIIVTYTFRLPEHREELELHQKAANMHTILWDIDQYCRSIEKHEDNPSEDRLKLAHTIRMMIAEESELF